MVDRKFINVKPEKVRLVRLISAIRAGSYRIPIFQRDFVWEGKDMLDLFDSISRGYPIGSLLFWIPMMKLKDTGQFGPYVILSGVDDYSYILDGFQRVSTLFGALINPNDDLLKVTDEKDLLKFQIFYDLLNKEFVPYKKSYEVDVCYIPLYVLIDTYEFLVYLDRLKPLEKSEELIANARELATVLIDYEIPYVEILGGDIHSAVEIFSRANSKGKGISTDWMISALSYVEGDFLLANEIDALLDELSIFNFDNLKRDTILHCIEMASGKPYFDVKIEEIVGRNDFSKLVREAFKSIKSAINFLYEECNVIDYKLLPYNTQLIFITEYFRLKENIITEIDKRRLRSWFWKTSYANYFTVYSLSKQRRALQYLKDFVSESDREIFYQDDINEEFNTALLPTNFKIHLGSVRMKSSLLFMLYTYFDSSNPGSLINNANETFEVGYLFTGYKDLSSVIIRLKSPLKAESKLRKIGKKDFSYLLDNPDLNENDKYFINKKVYELAKRGSLEEASYERLIHFFEKEKKFVKALGINYNNNKF